MNQSDSNNHWIFGIHAVESALKNAPHDIRHIAVAKDSGNKRLQRLIQAATAQKLPLTYESVEYLDSHVSGKHQGIIAHIAGSSFKGEQQLKQDMGEWQQPLILILDQIEDPRNLGACLRSADAAGVEAVIMTKNKSAPITAVTRSTAAGAVDHLQIYQVSNLARALQLLKKAGIWIYGTDCNESSSSLFKTDLRGATAVVVGNEGKGLRHLVSQECDHLMHIPMDGAVQSLNVSVATGIVLFEALRQRQEN